MRARVEWLSAAIIGVGVLAVTSRRWSGVLMASALGMGLFIGVAFGPAIDRLGALGAEVVAVDGGSSAAQPASATGEPPAHSPASDGGDPAAPVDAVPDPYIPPEPVPELPPEEVPPPAPPGDETPPGTDPGTDPTGFAGTVVHVNPLARSYALSVRGELYAVHTRKLPDPGAKVEVPLAELANGTYEEDGARASEGTTGSGSLNGFVTWVRDGGEPAYTVSMRGASVLVTVPPEGGSEPPKLGEFVEVEVAIEKPPGEEELQRLRKRARGLALAPASPNVPGVPDPPVPDPPVPDPPVPDPPAPEPPAQDEGCLRSDPVRYVAPRETLVQKSFEPSGDTYDYFDLAGYVQATCAEPDRLVLSADDIRAAGADLVLEAPKAIGLGGLDPDAPVLATAEVGEQGELTLAGLAGDAGATGADDEAQLQGDLGG